MQCLMTAYAAKLIVPVGFVIHCNVFVVTDAGTARSSPRGL